MVAIAYVKLSSTPTVWNLTLCNVNDEDTTWINFIDRFPLLEKLIIDGCSMMEYLHVSQQNLTNLVLYDCFVTREVRINSPKLKSLEYKGGFTFFEGIEALQELEFVELYLDPLKFRDYWYSWIRNLLESCAHSKHLSLICGIEELAELVSSSLPFYVALEHLLAISS
ncbi:hypothetical protein CQW23_17352 [Capsicum baccatum]|uniref:NB-ARC domain-containing protein n=1 Tax=Capsicum baccatum TaxID=33114 RepID=A0A2G2WDP0_CAPBA|nr:hypothetical protein CQW23_17352 [Capsicum baccatum]